MSLGEMGPVVGGGLGAVIPTKDRPAELLALLECLDRQTRPIDHLVVVDASAESVSPLLEGRLRASRIEYVRHHPPSAAAQRNAGIARLAGRYPLVGLFDDDIWLAPDAVERMLAFWASQASRGVAGTAFNQQGLESIGERGWLKRSRLADSLGLYRRTPGRVAASGWHALIGTVSVDSPVEWLQTGAAVWRAQVFDRWRFDEFFQGYSYLEDLDFSFSVSRQARLMVVADARYEHRSASAGRLDARRFGRIESRNRLYFVRKHGLSLAACLAGLGIRMGMSLGESLGHLDPSLSLRALGNLEGIGEGLGAPVASPRKSGRSPS